MGIKRENSTRNVSISTGNTYMAGPKLEGMPVIGMIKLKLKLFLLKFF